jgi:uncharacterized repeat protein (TIGR02543 family)
LKVPSGSVTAYRNADVWKEFYITGIGDFTVDVVSDKGTVTGGGLYDANNNVTVSATPSAGYRFVNWTVGGTPVSSDNPFTFEIICDTVLHANYEAIVYAIDYVLNGGTGHTGNPATYTVEDTITVKAPTRTYYNFAGWTGSDSILVNATGDRTFTAQWTPVAYSITYELGGGVNHADNPAIYTIESPLISLQSPTRTGYDFTGWTEGDSIAVGSTGDKTFTANWSLISYSISYELNGGVNYSGNPASYTVEDSISIKAPTKTGYSFAGWTDSDSVIVNSTGDKTFTAQWLAINYRIAYVLNNGLNHADNPATYTAGDAVTLQSPTRTGYDFTGWTEGDGITVGSTGDKTFTAKWSLISYSISYELNGGVNYSGNPASYTVEDSISIKAPTRTGYSFTGWTDSDSIIVNSTGDKTFTAQWLTINYSITYVLNEGVNHSDNPAGYTVIDALTLQSPTRTGYDFTGWTEGDEIAVGSTGDKTFTAEWSPVSYSINYELDGGVNHIDNPVTYTIEDSIAIKSPSKTGCSFAGWTGGDSILVNTAGDMTLTAQWSEIAYSIVYELNGGVNHADNPEVYTVSSSIRLQSPTRRGYDFSGWAEGSEIAVGSTGDKTFTAQWSLISYGVSYELDGGVNHSDNPASYTVNDAVTLKEPGREGFIFEGWTDGGVIAAGSTGERTFTALWKCVEANIEEIVINGIEMDISETSVNDSVFEYTARECDESSISLDLGASSQANVTVNGRPYVPGTEIAFEGDLTSVNIRIESETGDNARNYTLNVAAPLNVGSLYYQRWNDVIAVNRNPATNGGHNVSEIRWHKKDGTPAGNGGFIHVQSTESVNDYYSEVKTVETNAWHKVCTTEETRSLDKIAAYPNPVPRGEKLTLKLPDTYAGGVLNIYDIKGGLVKSGQPLPATVNSIDMSEFASGVYLLRISDKQGNSETIKIIVE